MNSAAACFAASIRMGATSVATIGLGHVQGDQHSPALPGTPLTSRC